MEIVIALFVLVGGSIGLSAWIKAKSPDNNASGPKDLDDGSTVRKCLICEYDGEMKKWIPNYITPKIIVIAGFIFGYIPGLIFLWMYWGKYMCPSCRSIGKNQLRVDKTKGSSLSHAEGSLL